jgi:ABC-type branched-subunit amino acid transport system ATPase component
VNLELQGITKRFGSLVANDHIDLSIAPGTIQALLGENGAGKTTLMNILYGLTQPDEGTILADGKPLTIHSPKDAIEAGIGMVHQHFMLVPVFTGAENVTLGNEEIRPPGLLDRRRMRRKVRDLSERYGLRVDPDALTGDLPVGVQQRVEILKALVRDAQVLILDEPTAVLTPGETEELFRITRGLTRYRDVILAGLVAGIGGAFLTIGSVGSFGKDMSSGKGYIALAAMIFGRWTLLGGVGVALLFGFTFELQSILSTVNVPIPSYFLLMVPYVATIIAVAGLVGQVRPPAADGQPYITS